MCLKTLQGAKKTMLHALISDLEALSPAKAPADSLELVQGDWKLLYSTITLTVRQGGDSSSRVMMMMMMMMGSYDTIGGV